MKDREGKSSKSRRKKVREKVSIRNSRAGREKYEMRGIGGWRRCGVCKGEEEEEEEENKKIKEEEYES